MLAQEIIYRYNEERSNEVDDNRKLTYVKQLERLIANEIILTHVDDEKIVANIRGVIKENEPEVSLLEDDENTDETDTPAAPVEKKEEVTDLSQEEVNKYFDYFSMNSELFGCEPYEDMYLHFIDMKIASSQNESKRYNAASTMYNNSYITFQDFYNRTHMPKSVYPCFIRHMGL